MRPLIYNTPIKDGKTLRFCSISFPYIALERECETQHSRYLVSNVSDGSLHVSLDNNATHFSTKNMFGIKYAMGSIKPYDIFDKIIVEVHRNEIIEEYVCNHINLIQATINYIDREHSVPNSELQIDPLLIGCDGNLHHLKPIILDKGCHKVFFRSYFEPRILSLDTSKFVPTPKPIPTIVSSDYWNPCTAYGLRSYITNLTMKVCHKEKQLILIHSELVDEREYTVISHSSMDPGPDEVSESTFWELKLCIQFSTRFEMMEYLDRIGAKELSQNRNLNSEPSTYVISFETPKTIEQINAILGFKCTESWRTDSCRY